MYKIRSFFTEYTDTKHKHLSRCTTLKRKHIYKCHTKVSIFFPPSSLPMLYKYMSLSWLPDGKCMYMLAFFSTVLVFYYTVEYRSSVHYAKVT